MPWEDCWEATLDHVLQRERPFILCFVVLDVEAQDQNSNLLLHAWHTATTQQLNGAIVSDTSTLDMESVPIMHASEHLASIAHLTSVHYTIIVSLQWHHC